MDDLRRFQHPRFARLYEQLGAEADARGATGHRKRLLAGLSGQVVEVGAGNGLNFPHYPPEVGLVLAVEPDQALRGRATRAASRAPVLIAVRAGHAEALPVASGSADAVVASLVLCSVPDQAHALAEMRRVLKPGGELRFYEHVRARQWWRGAIEDLVTPLWSRLGGGCHPNRRTTDAITAAGFEITELDQFPFKVSSQVPPTPHVLGRARAPR
ncbi:MAG TPA: class I SAM-dependent methyltransferase [Kineosporiaceae bacterium]|nr:class I SAM-dependent methyltransferase [Kineosporiaceae bacterium]